MAFSGRPDWLRA